MSDDKAKPQASARRNKPILSIRARLIVLALLAIAPLMLERVQASKRPAPRAPNAPTPRSIELARRGVEAQREIISSVRALLQIVARVFAKMPLDPSNCNQYLTDLTANVPWIRDISVAGTDGRIICSTESGGDRTERLRSRRISRMRCIRANSR